MRVYYYKSYKKLFSISSNNVTLFHIVILNFITNMSFAKELYIKKTCDDILILINKIIKYAAYVAITMNLKVDKFINIL